MIGRWAGSRLAVGGAAAVVLVLALVRLFVVRDGDGEEPAASSAAPSTTVEVAAATTATGPRATDAASAQAPSSGTASTAAGAATALTGPAATAAPSRPVGESLTTTAGAHGPVQAALTQARQRWLATRPAGGYVWSYENQCRCSPRNVEVTVDGGEAVTAVRELDGAPSARPVDTGLSVDAALAEVQAAIDADAARIRVRFDPARGLPSSYFVDRSSALADEERGLSLLTYTPRS